LLRFFRRSRDNWKAKCKAAKRENKSLKTRLAKMKESRDRWKARALHPAMQTNPEGPPPREGKNGVVHRPDGSRRRVA
jgi:hypothetical protein